MELEAKLIACLSRSDRPLSTTEISAVAAEPPHRTLRTLLRLHRKGRISGNQAKARGSWVWWSDKLTKVDVPEARRLQLEDAGRHLREDFGFQILDERVGSVPVALADRTVLFDHMAYASESAGRTPKLLVWVRSDALPESELGVASGACKVTGAEALALFDGASTWKWFKMNRRGTRLVEAKRPPAPQAGANSGSRTPFSGFTEIKKVVSACHDIIRDSAGLDPAESFEELSKLLFTRLQEETENSNGGSGVSGGALNKSRFGGRPRLAAEAARSLFRRAITAHPEVFEGLPKDFLTLRLSDSAIERITPYLQGYSLASTGIDVKGPAYEVMIKDTFTGTGLGQFFTPPEVVKFMVDMVRPGPSDRVLDPACGSGGFLIEAASRFSKLARASPSATEAIAPSIVGVELSPRMASVSRMNLVMHGVGNGRILSSSSMTDPLGLLVTKEGGPGLAKGFSVVLTNPPFGGRVADTESLERFELSQGRRSRQVEVLFTELCIKAALPGGRIGIVVPEGILHHPGESDLRELILRDTVIDAIVKLPEETFLPYGSTASSSILFLTKKPSGSHARGTFVALARGVGFDRNGDPQNNNDLPRIGRAFGDYLLGASTEELEKRYGGIPFFTAQGSELIERMDPSALRPQARQALAGIRDSPRLAPLSRFVRVVADGIDTTAYPDREYQYIGLGNVENFTGAFRPEVLRGRVLRSRCWVFRRGDILFGRLRPNLRKVAYVSSLPGGVCSSEFYVLRPLDARLGDVLASLLRSDVAYAQFGHLVTGIGRPRLAKSHLLSVRVPADWEDLVKIGRTALDFQNRVQKERAKAAAALERADSMVGDGNAKVVDMLRRLSSVPS